MALGDLTRQLAGEAIRNVTAPKPPAPALAQPEKLGAAIMAEVQAMQKALKEDEELIVLCGASGETIRVHEFYFPSWQIAVLTGTDKDRAVARLVAPVESLQLLCKVAKAPASAKAARIRFVTPRANTG